MPHIIIAIVIAYIISIILNGIALKDLSSKLAKGLTYQFLFGYFFFAGSNAVFWILIMLFEYLEVDESFTYLSLGLFHFSDEIKSSFILSLGLDVILTQSSIQIRKIIFTLITTVPGILWFILYESFPDMDYLINSIDVLINTLLSFILYVSMYGKLRSLTFVKEPAASKSILLFVLKQWLYFIYAIYFMAIFKKAVGGYFKLLISFLDPLFYILLVSYQSPLIHKFIYPWLHSEEEGQHFNDLRNLTNSIYEGKVEEETGQENEEPME